MVYRVLQSQSVLLQLLSLACLFLPLGTILFDLLQQRRHVPLGLLGLVELGHQRLDLLLQRRVVLLVLVELEDYLSVAGLWPPRGAQLALEVLHFGAIPR